MNTRLLLATALLCCAAAAPLTAGADPWEVHREVREGKREVDRERREARDEIQAERCHKHWPQTQYLRNTPNHYYQHARYYGDTRYYGRNVWDGAAHFHPGGH